MPFTATWVTYTVSDREEILYDISYMWNLKGEDTNELDKTETCKLKK